MRQRLAVLGIVSVLALACGLREPRAIAYGAEACVHCHMTITDPRFSAEAITSTGKIVVFDDVGCIAEWLGQNSQPVQSTWVSSFVDGRWLEASTAVYLKTETLHSPMASGTVALRPGREADSVRSALGGSLTAWREVLAAPPRHAPVPAPTS